MPVLKLARTVSTTLDRTISTVSSTAPQRLPSELVQLIFQLAISSCSSTRERLQLCLRIALVSHEWTLGLTSLYASQLTFKKRRFFKSSHFAQFLRQVETDKALASAVASLNVDLGLVEKRIGRLLLTCRHVRHLTLRKGNLCVAELASVRYHADVLASLTTLRLEAVTCFADQPHEWRVVLGLPQAPAHSLALLPSLHTLVLNDVHFQPHSATWFLSPTSLPALTSLATAHLDSSSSPDLATALRSVSPHLTSLVIGDSLSWTWTHQALLRCHSVTSLTLIETSPDSLRPAFHSILATSPWPLASLHLVAQFLKRPTLAFDTLETMLRALTLAVRARRTSVKDLARLQLSGAWCSDEMRDGVDVLRATCAWRGIELVLSHEATAFAELAEELMEDGVG
ncbi:hypothetical protein JCM1840_005135 [Sporobolomyces johnsonii]